VARLLDGEKMAGLCRYVTLYRREAKPDSSIHFRASATVGKIFAS